MNSSLVNFTRISPNYSTRTSAIKKITIHHMAGNLSVETCGKIFASSSRQASANYGIGSDGRVGMYVEERFRAWTSSNRDNDNQAVTIEVANSKGSPNWEVSDKALAKLIDLCVDICKRNGISRLNFTGDKNGNLTIHSMFSATTCPGPYLKGKLHYIAEQVNAKLNTPIVAPQQPAPTYKLGQYISNGIDYGYVFDHEFYSNTYADLKKAFGMDKGKLFNHFLTNGMKEERLGCPYFNVKIYRNNYADLRNSFGSNTVKYYTHFCIYGYKENRVAR